MPSHPTAPPGTPTTEESTTAPDLTVNKVLAGAGAAATAAVLGSYVGAVGTVAGAAIGSVASTVATTLYQRSLDRTRASVVSRIRPGAIPPQRGGDADADIVVLSPVAPPRRRWRRAAVGAVVVFLLGLATVTGLEWVKGSTLTQDESGTSVGRVVAPSGDSGGSEEEPAPEEDAPPASEDGDDVIDGIDPSAVPDPTDTPPTDDPSDPGLLAPLTE